MGANQAALGESRPDNFSAIVAQQKQAGIPLESVRRRFYQYIEDVALIWLDFYKNMYNLPRSINVDVEGLDEPYNMTVTGTDFADVYLSTKIDVGASSQWSELIQIEALRDLWDRGIFDKPEQGILYVESIPDNLLGNKAKIIEFLEGKVEESKMAPPVPPEEMINPGVM
jgi:hypothetical protein